MLRCDGGRVYTGITTDVARRFRQHRAGTGGRFTRSFRPAAVIYREPCASHSDALRREAAIKRLDKRAKLRLVRGFTMDGKKNIMTEQ